MAHEFFPHNVSTEPETKADWLAVGYSDGANGKKNRIADDQEIFLRYDDDRLDFYNVGYMFGLTQQNPLQAGYNECIEAVRLRLSGIAGYAILARYPAGLRLYLLRALNYARYLKRAQTE